MNMPNRLQAPLPKLDLAAEWLNVSDIADLQRQLANKAVLLHFWAVSCHLCKEGLPLVNHWLAAYGERYGLAVIGVHMPRLATDHDTTQITHIIRQYELEHPIALDRDLALSSACSNEHVPAFYLYDSKHRLRHVQAGGHSLAWLDRRIRKLLGVNE